MNLPIKKTCGSCGEVHETVRDGTLCSKGNLYFNCTCRTTLFVKKENTGLPLCFRCKRPILTRKGYLNMPEGPRCVENDCENKVKF